MNFQQRLTLVVGYSLLTVIIVAVVDYVLWPLTGYRWPFLVAGLPAAGWLLARFLPGTAAQHQPAPVFEPQAPAPPESPPPGPSAPAEPARSPLKTGAVPAKTGEPDAKCPGTDILYQQLVVRSPAGIALLDRAGTLKFVNSAGAKLLGTEPGEQTTLPPILDFVPPNDHPKVNRWLGRVKSGNHTGPLEQITRSGLHLNFAAVLVPTGDAPFIQLIMTDNSRQKAAEAEFAAQTRTLTTFQSAGVAITSRLDLRYVLDTVAHEMTKLVGVERCIIFQWEQDRGQIVKLAQFGPNGWWDSNAAPEIYALSEYPQTAFVLDEQIPAQMTLSQPDLDPFEQAYMQRVNIKTLLLLPMIFQRRVFGLVKLEDSRLEREFTVPEISAARLLAGQAASAIENARMYDELRQYVVELETLNDISQAIISTFNLDEILNIICEQIAALLHAKSTRVALFDDSSQTIAIAAAFGPGAKKLRSATLAFDQGITSWVIEHGEPALVPDVTEDPRFGGIVDQLAGQKTESAISVPLVARKKIIGALTVINKTQGAFTPEDMRLLNLIAATSAAVIQNARLFVQAQQEIEERQRAEAALEQERALLAQRVEERTAELSKANAELARASRLKDEFLAGMSHELRTPLNAIIGSSEILKTQVFGEMSDKQHRYANNIEESGRHLLSLINDILDLSKIEAGKVDLDIVPVSIENVCQASLRLVKQLAHKKQLTVSAQFNNSNPVLEADERKLKQILVNLLSNAIKFTPEGGEIGLDVSEDDRQEVVYFTVWDSGIGIAENDLQKLFQPFVQLDSSLSRQYAGTGLGLSLVSRMAELHGGSISVSSEVGQGSRFTVLLPYANFAAAAEVDVSAEPEPVSVASQPEAVIENRLVLLADDNEENIRMLYDFLQVQNYQIIVARNGKEALLRAREQFPDIILMDIQMPVMDGMEATRAIRQSPGLEKVPIIALTALAMPGDRERCLNAGANDYLSKPVSPTGLVETMAACFNVTAAT